MKTKGPASVQLAGLFSFKSPSLILLRLASTDTSAGAIAMPGRRSDVPTTSGFETARP